MKVLLLLPLLFFATSASAQVFTADTQVNTTSAISKQVVVEKEIPAAAAAQTEVASSSALAQGTDTATTSVNTETPSPEEQEAVTETIEIIPGSISLKLTAPKPAVKSQASTSLAGPKRATQQQPDGLFNLIYTGFEEFVFRVFGI